MTTINKHAIKQRLAEYCRQIGSQNKAAVALDVSEATVSDILNEKWERISDDMWRRIAAAAGYNVRDWNIVETRGYRRLFGVLSDAQADAQTFTVTGDAGCGKSETIRAFARQYANVITLSCCDFWNLPTFMAELLRAMGVDAAGSTTPEMMSAIISSLNRRDGALIVLDEADKLSDRVLYFLITLYNNIEDRVGMVLCSTDYMKMRIERGLQYNRKGYKEISSRFGRRFIPLQAINADDVAAACRANGVNDPTAIREIYADCDNDLRRVKRKVYALKKSIK
ncbi:MAG: AAA family ATPase [Rikenellaceae bacterium]|jgi:DNA transposition AAA+ family ATPase|nr:AAA family ATPase [Rikenellaceae bacterium]